MKYKTRVVLSDIPGTFFKTTLVLYDIPQIGVKSMLGLDDIPEMRMKTSFESSYNLRTFHNQTSIKV